MDAKKVRSGTGDAISSLPDEILIGKILSLLPTKLAASTSLLSKRWRNLFPSMIHLFASQHHFCLDYSDLLYPEGNDDGKPREIKKSFKSFVDKTLSSCSSMKKLSLKCQYDNLISLALIDQWIYKALELGLVDLDLYLETSTVLPRTRGRVSFPSCFYINKSLVKLTLAIYYEHFLLVSPEEVCLPVLKSLFLHGDWSSRIEPLCHAMLPGCPILEELSLQYSRINSFTHVTSSHLCVVHNSLKRVTLHNDGHLDYPTVIFNTPSLVYLDYSGLAPLRDSTANFLDTLVEAKLDVRPSISGTKELSIIVNWMRNVKTLSLSSASVKAIYSHLQELPRFLNLVKLSFESDTEQGWEVLPRMLNKSPKLETLVLKGLHCVRKEGLCIAPNEVKVLKIYGFRGSVGEVRQLKLFLCQMESLQVMNVEIDADDDNKKLRLTSRLPDLLVRHSKFQINLL